MKLDTRRLLIGRFLLTVYLLILSLSVFHVHEQVEDDFVCQDCINHVDHAGHISVDDVSMGDCLLCSFFSTSYLAAEIVALATVVLVLHRDFVEQTSCVVYRTKRIILLRGPPTCL